MSDWQRYYDAAEQADTGRALYDLAGDLAWLAEMFPDLATDATALRSQILALPGWGTPNDQALIREARGWISDCRLVRGDVADLDDLTVERIIGRWYEGGWYQFVRDNAALTDG